MKRTTAKFLADLRRSRSVRNSIARQVNESRYYAFAQTIEDDSKVRRLAENGQYKPLTDYIYQHQGDLGLPVRLSMQSARRLARVLIANK